MYLLTMAMFVTAAPVQAGDPAPQADVPQAATGAASPPAAPLHIANPSEPPLPDQAQRPTHDPAGNGDIIVRARDVSDAPDPLRALNAQSFAATEAVDKALIGPVSIAYKKHVPSPFRSGVHNFLYNMREPVVFVNFVFQHKIGKAAETVARFAINTTVGVAGVFDMAKRRAFKLPRRGNGFADTLGFYGVPNGPFMFLPIVGPTTVRDLFGGAVDRLVLPLTFGSRITRPSYAVPAAVLGVLDHRAEFDETLHTLHDGVPDPYENTRAFYLQRRQGEIDHLRGRSDRNSSPMSEAPTAPIRMRGVHPATPPSPAPEARPPESATPSP
ncbi:VacJ family lipoprotein [Sphingomonas sp. GC_Shp_6]|uniref:MlaA family lipoprotein n=2 Tax=unclassified Sphingomonas TaxID=196159 RepID=UPI002269FC2E|nr:VacJ family lipoprotein [Sphingomonas sp. GC_Shp_6]